MTRFAGLLLFALAACSNAAGGSFDEHLRRGAAALEAGEPKTARIELLNAIKARPDDRRARLLQAKVHLALRDGVAAEAEVARARELGVSPAATRTLMAEALLLQGRNADALAEAEAAPPAHAAEGARLAGRALAELGQGERAAEAFDRALALDDKDAELWLDIARFRRSTGEAAGAIAAADRALAIDPALADALILRGELTRAQYGLKAALPWFDRALEIEPDNATALLEQAATLGELGRMEEMLAASRAALKAAPGHPVAYYLQAVMAARAGEFALARSIHSRAGGALDDQPAPALFAAALDYEAGNYSRAAARLGKLVEAQPDNARARLLLAASQWRAGDAADALAAVRPLADRPGADSYALILAARAAAATGDARRAAEYRSRASRPEPAGFDALPAQGREADGAAGEVLEIRARIAAGDSAGALVRARQLQAAHREAPDGHVLVGDALMLAGDAASAAQAYRAAANLAFTEPIAMRLVQALEASGNAAGAAQALSLFLDQNPRSVPALLLAAERYLAAGEWGAAAGVYESLRQRLGDGDAAMLSNLAWAYAKQGAFDAALPLAAEAWALDPDNPAATDGYGWLLFKSGADRARGLALLMDAAAGR